MQFICSLCAAVKTAYKLGLRFWGKPGSNFRLIWGGLEHYEAHYVPLGLEKKLNIFEQIEHFDKNWVNLYIFLIHRLVFHLGSRKGT